jgi:hypothetical protein
VGLGRDRHDRREASNDDSLTEVLVEPQKFVEGEGTPLWNGDPPGPQGHPAHPSDAAPGLPFLRHIGLAVSLHTNPIPNPRW